MASSIPSQARAVDPFATYNSDTVNTLTRMLTYGENGIATPLSCDVALDSTSNTQVVLQPGFVYQDDVWINIDAQHVVDFTDLDQYYDSGAGFDEAGWYYVVLEYTYAKSRPAPDAKAIIVKPLQRPAYTPGGSWLFLKAVKVEWTGFEFVIVGVSNFDPQNTDNKRLYIATYAGAVVGLPTHLPERDTGRFTYGMEEDDFFFGLSDRWVSLGGGFQADTSSFELGDLVYALNTGNVAKAIALLGLTTADGVVANIGSNGTIRTTGRVDNVQVQSGSNVTEGTLVFLSKTEPGTVTEQQSSPFSQFVGRCVEVVDSTSVAILFHRGEPQGTTDVLLSVYVEDTLTSGGSWISSGPDYYQDVDISDLGQKNVVISIWDDATEFEIQPGNIEFVSDSIMRIWMPVNTQTLHILAVGPSTITVSSSNVGKVTDTLSAGGSWISSGPSYYQDVNVASLTGQNSVVELRDASNGEVVIPENVQFDTASNLRIWMPVNTETLNISVFGPTATPAATVVISAELDLIEWIPSGPDYYQDVDITGIGSNDVSLQFYDIDTDEVVVPSLIDFQDANTVRVWMPVNTVLLNVTIIG
ncbi:MAG: hypothetical protein ACTSX1_14395 [Candidatus Heimdallarchaeaceae archaeon]